MNLDFEASKLSQEIVSNTTNFKSSDVENLVTKTLGVLQENGVYACMLYLLSRDNEMSRCVVDSLLKMVELIEIKLPVTSSTKNEEILNSISYIICNDLDTLFLTKELWEQILLYARYGAKAR
jgi:hypothetical protein